MLQSTNASYRNWMLRVASHVLVWTGLEFLRLMTDIYQPSLGTAVVFVCHVEVQESLTEQNSWKMNGETFASIETAC